MTSPIAAFTADWHIRKNDRIWGGRRDIVGDVSCGVQQVVDIVRDRRVPHLFIAGDILDESIQRSDAAMTLRGAMDQFQGMRCSVDFVQGQHERAEPTWLEALHAHPQHLHNRVSSIADGIYVVGLDYQPPGAIAEATQDLPCYPDDHTILLTHQVWKDWMGEGRGEHWMHDISQPFDTIVTGDLHSYKRDEVVLTLNHVAAAFSPGPLCPQDISEPSVTGILLLHDDMTWETVRLRTRQRFEIDLPTEDHVQEFITHWPDSFARAPQNNADPRIAKNIVRVRYNTNVPEARQRLLATMANDVHVFFDPVTPEQVNVPPDRQAREAAVASGGLAGCIQHLYADAPSTMTDAIRLLNAAEGGDLQPTIESIFKERVAYGTAQAQSAEATTSDSVSAQS